jgi:hypothetical protein
VSWRADSGPKGEGIDAGVGHVVFHGQTGRHGRGRPEWIMIGISLVLTVRTRTPPAPRSGQQGGPFPFLEMP